MNRFLPLALVGTCLVLSAQAAVDGQVNFRVRAGFSAPLNADEGWAGALNENVTIFADRPFRIRFEVERANHMPGDATLRLQCRRNAEPWTDLEAHDFPHPESEHAKTPRVSLVSCAAYLNGAATTDLLAGSPANFQAGVGVGLAERTRAWSGSDVHSEVEWAIVVRRFADNAVTNEAGDTFEFRMVGANGAALGEYRTPRLTLAIAPGHVGGTFVETPGRIGPWRTKNGDLYFIMEPAETSNLFMMIKSTDDGRTWREVDGANRPPTRDLESVDARQVGDTIHVLHQVTRSSRYHSFRTSDHPTHPDSWDIRGEQVGAVQSVAQAATLVVRSDASMVAFYVGQTNVHASITAANGGWSEVAVIDSAVGPQAVLGANDVVHLAYYRPDGTIWYQRMLRNGSLTAPEQLARGLQTTRAEFGAVLPLVYIPQTNTAIILYRVASGHLWERRIVNDHGATSPVKVTDRPVIQSAVDSQQPGADVVVDGTSLHVLFIDQETHSIYSTTDAGGWQPSIRRVDKILGSWVRGNVYTRRDGAKVHGYIYDAGSDGGAGMNRFADLILTRQK